MKCFISDCIHTSTMHGRDQEGAVCCDESSARQGAAHRPCRGIGANARRGHTMCDIGTKVPANDDEPGGSKHPCCDVLLDVVLLETSRNIDGLLLELLAKSTFLIIALGPVPLSLTREPESRMHAPAVRQSQLACRLCRRKTCSRRVLGSRDSWWSIVGYK